MKIYIALFTTLIAAGHFTNVSAAGAAAPTDGASYPHLRALADAAVDVACPNGSCNNDNHCDGGEVCIVQGGSGGCTGTCWDDRPVSSCPEGSQCDSNGNGCYDGTTCDPSFRVSDGCFGCRINDEMEASSLRASILKEE
mmetsp:Transcript_29426/g.43236  ORF Transcript_29426/g.43236 Transcript_29426/m.43236 type:complete len:140 (-) Transcript_29426:4-423(-)|eukprot:scaffold1636_cov103-Skeletonema_dohrnii-CCMP3373.AAC.3